MRPITTTGYIKLALLLCVINVTGAWQLRPVAATGHNHYDFFGVPICFIGNRQLRRNTFTGLIDRHDDHEIAKKSVG